MVSIDFVDLDPKDPLRERRLLGEDGLPERSRHRDRRARAAAVLVQRPVGRLPRVLRARHPDGGRPGAGRPGRREEPGRRGHRPVGVGACRRLLHPADRLAGRERRVQHHGAVASAAGRGPEDAAVRRARPGARAATGTGTAASAATTPSTRASSPTSSVGTAEAETDTSRERFAGYMREVPCHACHGARLKPTSLAVTVGDRNIAEIVGDVDRRGGRLPPPAGAHRSGAPDRRAGAEGDQRAAQVPARRRPGLPLAEPARPGACPAARPSGSASRPRSAPGWSGCCTCWTSRASDCTSGTTGG